MKEKLIIIIAIAIIAAAIISAVIRQRNYAGTNQGRSLINTDHASVHTM